jgi:hypothetical protein
MTSFGFVLRKISSEWSSEKKKIFTSILLTEVKIFCVSVRQSQFVQLTLTVPDLFIAINRFHMFFVKVK